MNCLCCGKPLKETNIGNWHSSCIKKFFSTSKLPEIDVTEEFIRELANESVNKGLTVTGVQKKLSLHLTKESSPRLTLVNYPTGYIFKPQLPEYTALPQAEYLVMQMAQAVKINTVPFALIECGTGPAYITKRIDRQFKRNDIIKFAMEDFCQLGERLTEDKYNSSYEQCAKIIRQFSFRSGIDLAEFFLRLVFCFAVGNSDMHLKNFSLIESFPESGKYVLSPAYDLLPVNVIMPSDKDETALTLCGKRSNIDRKDFLRFAEEISIESKAAENIIDSVVSKEGKFVAMVSDSYLPEEMKDKMISLINHRIMRLK